MAVILRTSRDVAPVLASDRACRTPGTEAALPAGTRPVADLAHRLEDAFGAIRDRWWTLGRKLGAEPTADIAHMPTCSTYGSDFGVMLAWGRVVADLARDTETTLVVCDDPWLFRHLATLPGVAAGRAPALVPIRIALCLRGVLARTRIAVRLARARLRLVRLRSIAPAGAPSLLVYGHPGSNAAGIDAFFGRLMLEVPALIRLLHTDTGTAEALRLAPDGRTASLHGWGRLPWILALPFSRWRPRSGQDEPDRWLTRRAADREGARGGGAMNRWQIRCQAAWLDDRRPAAIGWPWENHPWERALSRQARALGIRTIGFQHTVIGPHMFNQSPATNWDGFDSLPDLILCNGPAYRDQLLAWGVPAGRLAIGGNLRLAEPGRLRHDPEGPIFVALSSDAGFSRQMLAAIEPLAEGGLTFLVKGHPLYPVTVTETPRLRPTDRQLQDHDGLAGVIYCTGAVGLEALMGGLPTIRFLPEGAVAMDILPPGIRAVATDAAGLAAAIAAMTPPPAMDPATILSPPDWNVWRQALKAA